jgi:hypothetical protein
MPRQRSDAESQVADLLHTARESLGLSLAFLTRMDGTVQHLEVVDSSIPLVFRDGVTQRQDTTFCQAIMDGKLPAVMPDVKNFPEAMKLPAARMPRFRSFVSVPVVLGDGTVYGTFCAAGFAADKQLSKRDKALMDVLAHAASVIIEPSVRQNARNAEIESRIGPVIDNGGPVVLLQPIVDLATRRRVGVEALSRFPREWDLAPDLCFADAHLIGEGDRLELLALQRAADHLAHVTGYVAMNVSPATLLTTECTDFLDRLPLDRIVLELSEHDQVADYDALKAILAPLRARGMRLAIDDVGAGSQCGRPFSGRPRPGHRGQGRRRGSGDRGRRRRARGAGRGPRPGLALRSGGHRRSPAGPVPPGISRRGRGRSGRPGRGGCRRPRAVGPVSRRWRRCACRPRSR